MKPRSDELVQFISRTFLAAVVAIAIGSSVLVALFYRRGTDEGWVRHSRETSRVAREVEIASLRRLSVLRGHAAFGGPVTAEALGLDDPRIHAQLDSLSHLTQDSPAQQTRAGRIAAAFARWDSILMPPALQRPDGPRLLTVDRFRIDSA